VRAVTDIVDQLKTAVAEAGSFATAIIPKHMLVDAAREVTHLRTELRKERRAAVNERLWLSIFAMIMFGVGFTFHWWLDAKLSQAPKPQGAEMTKTFEMTASLVHRRRIYKV
jgi:hypothetical protein